MTEGAIRKITEAVAAALREERTSEPCCVPHGAVADAGGTVAARRAERPTVVCVCVDACERRT